MGDDRDPTIHQHAADRHNRCHKSDDHSAEILVGQHRQHHEGEEHCERRVIAEKQDQSGDQGVNQMRPQRRGQPAAVEARQSPGAAFAEHRRRDQGDA